MLAQTSFGADSPFHHVHNVGVDYTKVIVVDVMDESDVADDQGAADLTQVRADARKDEAEWILQDV